MFVGGMYGTSALENTPWVPPGVRRSAHASGREMTRPIDGPGTGTAWQRPASEALSPAFTVLGIRASASDVGRLWLLVSSGQHQCRPRAATRGLRTGTCVGGPVFSSLAEEQEAELRRQVAETNKRSEDAARIRGGR